MQLLQRMQISLDFALVRSIAVDVALVSAAAPDLRVSEPEVVGPRAVRGFHRRPQMTDTVEATTEAQAVPAETVVPARAPQTKTATVQKLLSRNKGATLGEIMTATHWQPHSTRAFLTGLRKKGIMLLRETRGSGESSWRIER
jgi:hypothetical protein